LNLQFKIKVWLNHAERVAGLYRSHFCILQQKRYNYAVKLLFFTFAN